MSDRRAFVTFVAALALTMTGVVALVLQPQSASAGVTPGVTPDFVIRPGDTKTETFNKPLFGSVEVRPNPDECRNDPVMGLTCAAHRLKVERKAGYKLTIQLFWDAAGEAGVFLPDVDLYLFDEPTSKLDSQQFGGAGTAMPEELSVFPEQDEYDIVVQAWGGAIANYKLVLYYTNAPLVANTEVPPDIVLSPHDPPFIKEYTTLLTTTPGFAFFPEGCRNDPANDTQCDVYRIKLNRNKAPNALNFVVLNVSWDAIRIPEPDLVVTALDFGYSPDIDIRLYDQPEHYLEGLGGVGFSLPERIAWPATQDEYDLVVQSKRGDPVTGYTIEAFMTDEIFDKPFELLDPETGKPFNPVAGGGEAPTQLTVDKAVDLFSPLPLAPVGADEQIAGIGLGTTEQFDLEEAIRLGEQALRNTAAVSEAPSTVLLVLFLGVIPLGMLAAALVVMRRRHVDLF